MVKLAIDLGSSMTKICRADTNNGIVLAEPSCVAVGAENQDIKAIGKAAKALIGKTTDVTDIVYPISEGEIVDMRLAVEMLKGFLSRIEVKANALKRALVVFSVPCGITEPSLAAYKSLVEECGLRKVHFVEQPCLAALGAGVLLGEPVFCLDIGGGVTNVAVVSADGVISGMSFNIGGNSMDANIISKISETYQLLIGTLSAERIKKEIGTMADTPCGTTVAEGMSTETMQPASKSVRAEDIAESLSIYIKKIIEYASTALLDLPVEVAAAVSRGGVYLSGGILNIPYMPRYIGDRLGMRYYVCEEPQFATVLGGGVLLRDKDLLGRFSRKMK